jgi:hypothetical protein
VSAASAAVQGRRFAGRLYGSACVVTRGTGVPTTDPETGEVTNVPGDAVYSGPCRVRPAGTQGSTQTAGGAEVFTFDYVISLPFSEADVMEGDRVTVAASPDMALVGLEVEVRKVDRGETVTARRLYCTDVA